MADTTIPPPQKGTDLYVVHYRHILSMGKVKEVICELPDPDSDSWKITMRDLGVITVHTIRYSHQYGRWLILDYTEPITISTRT